jgi:hypothetical protein
MTTKPQQNVDVIHSNELQILPYRKEELVVDVVDNPVNPGKVSVIRNCQDDPLAGMMARRFIDSAQFAAGRHWQQCYEDSEIGAVRAIDPTKEPVQGGKGPSCMPFTDKQRDAFRELQRASVVLGYEGDRIIREVLASRCQLSAVALKHRRSKKYIGRRFKECLETMAKLWSYA